MRSVRAEGLCDVRCASGNMLAEVSTAEKAIAQLQKLRCVCCEACACIIAVQQMLQNAV